MANMESTQIVQCNLFNKGKEDELMKFVHLCIDEICYSTGPGFRQFSNIDWTKQEFDATLKFLLCLLQNPSCLYTNEEKMPAEYHELPENAKSVILTCLKVRKSQLTDALLYRYSCKYMPTLLDFDWRLKYIMGSSKIALLREPIVQLDLIVKEKEKEQILGIELDKEELDLLIEKIETVIN